MEATKSDLHAPARLRVHYSRRDGSYEGWGLHAWGEALERQTTWAQPLPFSGCDDWGRLVDLEVKTPGAPLHLIIHRGDQKDLSLDRSVDTSKVHEVWIKQGRPDLYLAPPPNGPEVVWAEILDHELLRLRIEGPGSGEAGCPPAARLKLFDHKGQRVAIAERWCEEGWVFVRPRVRLELADNFFFELDHSRQAAHLGDRLLDEEFFYDGTDLGATLRPDGSALFKLWSPPATRVVLHLFAPAEQTREIGTKELVREPCGVWSATLAPTELPDLGSLDAVFYQYEVTAYGKTERALDPYAKSMASFVPGGADTVGKAAVVDPRRVDPFGFRADDFSNLGRRPGRSFARLTSEADFVGYELHVRDWTIDPESGVPPELRGTYRGFVAERPLGYLAQLCVSHVQLMPVQNYYSVDENDRVFKDGTRPGRNYNWGYDPHNYFSPEGWLSSNPADPYARVRELKELVLALHRKRIGVVLDVVYNHLYDARILENAAPGCYLRLDASFSPSGKTGAGPSLETRGLMARKLVVDSVRYFVEEYGVDGFRFDLMGFLDVETMRAIRRAVGEDALLYGEAWDMTDLPGGQATTKGNMPREARLAAFSDSTRDAYAGRMQASGFAQGEPWGLPKVRAGIIGNVREYQGPGISDDPYDRFAREPTETLNYLSIHDGFTLWDKLNLSMSADAQERARVARMAMAMLFTSQGRLILHGGDEMGRTKPLSANDPSPDRAHTSGVVAEEPELPGVRHFHENSYASPDFTNMVRWGRLGREPFASMAGYLRDLVRMRAALPALRFATSEQVRRGLRFIGGSDASEAVGGAGYGSFEEIPSLTLEFVHGPANTTCWVAGEVLPAGSDESKNPVKNPFSVRFDEKGEGRISFSRGQIAHFDLKAWSDPRSLQIKLVTAPGSWSTPERAYTHTGNNTVRPAAVRRDNAVTIDLAIQDHVAGSPAPGELPFVAFELDNTLTGAASPYDRLVVVYNAGKKSVGVQVADIEDPKRWRVLLDPERFSIHGLAGASEIWISRGCVLAPRQSVVVIGRSAR